MVFFNDGIEKLLNKVSEVNESHIGKVHKFLVFFFSP